MYAQVATVDVPYQKFVLKNGLTLIVHEDHKAPIVAVNIWYHVGSKNERPGKTGFAHLFEHLMFGGSEHHQKRYIEAMEPIGATDLNGTTNSDRTNYFENVPTSALDYTLWLESDRMGHLLGAIDQKTLDLQRGVVQNEKRQGENQPYGLAYELITKATYPAGHPYSWTVIGSMDDLNAASMSDVQEWFKTYYGPSNAVLCVAGDIDANTARQKVEKYFGDIPAGPPIAANRVWIAKMTGTHRQVAQDRVPQARIYKVWNVPQNGSPDADYLDLLARVLSQGKSSRLYKRLVYDDQIATDVSAFNFDPRDRRPIPDSGDRPAGRRSDQGRKGHRRGTGASARGRSDGRGDGAREESKAGRVRARHRTGRWVRRKIGSAGQQPDLPGQPRRLQGQPQTYRRRNRRRPSVGRKALAVRRRLYSRSPSLPEIRDSQDRRRIVRSCPTWARFRNCACRSFSTPRSPTG